MPGRSQEFNNRQKFFLILLKREVLKAELSNNSTLFNYALYSSSNVFNHLHED